MNTKKYALLGQVAEIAKSNYENYHQRTDFIDILKYCDNNNLLFESPRPVRAAQHLLSAEELRAHTYTLTLDAHPLLSNDDETYLEDSMIPSDKDIFLFVHLPYIQGTMHKHDYFEINYAYKGSFTQFFENEKKEFQTGDLVIIAPGSPHIVQVSDEGLVFSINIRSSTFDKLFWQLLGTNDMLSTFFKHSLYGNHSQNYLLFTIEQTESYETLIQQIFDESNRTDDYANTLCVSLTNLFFGKLLREFGKNIHLYHSNHSDTFNKDFPLIMKYIQYNYASVTLSELADVFHYSEVYISKMFKKNLNQRFSSILQDLKLFHARQFLETAEYTLEEIARKVGYESPDYLSRLFKKTFHILPSQYRQSFKKQ